MTAVVAIDSLAKVFGGLRAVDRVSLEVAAGERRALIGPNGAGKTTLFHCVTGTLRPSSGSVRLFGHDVTYLPEYERTRLGMGRTFQITNVFTELSLAENLALAIIGTDRRKWVFQPAARCVSKGSRAGPRGARGGRPRRPRRRAGEAPVLRRAPPARAGARAQYPSKGAVPRRALRRALAERTSTHRQDGARAAASITVVMIEHDMDVALGLADRVTVMNRGRVMAEGTPAEVQSNPEVRDVYFGHV